MNPPLLAPLSNTQTMLVITMWLLGLIIIVLNIVSAWRMRNTQRHMENMRALDVNDSNQIKVSYQPTPVPDNLSFETVNGLGDVETRTHRSTLIRQED